GTFGNGVYRSTNDGANWIQVNAGLTNFNPRGFLVHGAYIFASFWGGGIYRSSNNGTDWFPVGSGITNLNDWRIIEVGNNLFLASFGGGVYRSTNDGLNWTTVNSGLTNLNVYCFALIGSNLFAGTAAGVFTTTNSGANWSLANQGIVGSVQTILSKGSNLIAGTTSGVFRSTNNGMTWTAFNQSLSNLNVLSMVDNDTHLFAGTNGSSVYRRLLSEIIISVNVISTQVPDAFGMSQNYPNPFNPVTKFNFQLPGSENVKVTVYDQLGKEAAILVNEKLSAGSYEVEFNAANFTSGVYFYKIDAGNFTNIKKMILLK
ncbi:MAG: T9SS type A sorting domain-containing protein, partial [bacterium]